MGRLAMGCAMSVYSQLRRFSASCKPPPPPLTPPSGVSVQHRQLRLRGSSCSAIMTRWKFYLFFLMPVITSWPMQLDPSHCLAPAQCAMHIHTHTHRHTYYIHVCIYTQIYVVHIYICICNSLCWQCPAWSSWRCCYRFRWCRVECAPASPARRSRQHASAVPVLDMHSVHLHGGICCQRQTQCRRPWLHLHLPWICLAAACPVCASHRS